MKFVNRFLGILIITTILSSYLISQTLTKHCSMNSHYIIAEVTQISHDIQNNLNSQTTFKISGADPINPNGLLVRLTQGWSTINARWENLRKTENEYPNGKISADAASEVRRRYNYFWQNEKWESSGYWGDETDVDGNYNKTVSYGSAGGTYQEIYYNAPYTNGQPASWLSLLKSGSEWVNQQRGENTYNSDGDRTEQIVENWENESWVKNFMGVYTYTQPGCFDQIVWYNDDNGTWNANSRNTYVYGETGCITQMVPYAPWELEACNPTQIINETSTDNGATWIDNGTNNYSNFSADCLPQTYSWENWDGNQAERHFDYDVLSVGKISSTYDNSNLRCTKITSKEFVDNIWVNSEKIWLSYQGLMLKTISESVIPDEFTLTQNYPNPFNPNTNIDFSLSEKTNVQLSIYDLSGKLIKELTNTQMQIGNYNIVWDGTSTDGVKVGAGVYLYQLQTDNFSETRKMILLK